MVIVKVHPLTAELKASLKAAELVVELCLALEVLFEFEWAEGGKGKEFKVKLNWKRSVN